MKKEYDRFCDLLCDMIKSAEMTHIDFYTKLGIKKPYFYDILKGNTNPPPPEKQFKMIEILKPNNKDEIICFFELAAKERKEVPADIAVYLKDKSIRSELRKKRTYKEALINSVSNKKAGEMQ